MGLSVNKKILKEAGRSPKITVTAPIDEVDIDATIRGNILYLLDQIILDIAASRLEAEHGAEWLSKVLVGMDPQKWLNEVDRFRFHLEKVVEEVAEQPGWHFQNMRIEELPRPTNKWLSQRSGLSVGKINQLIYAQNENGTFGGKPFKVSELILLANALSTTLQFLLTPKLDTILQDPTISYHKGNRKRHTRTTVSQWHLWLFSLVPLPEQNQFLFEKHGSHFAGFREEKKSRNEKPGISPAAKSAADIEFGPLTAFRRIADDKPLEEKFKVKPDMKVPAGKLYRNAELEILQANLGLFVELRKLLRHSTLSESKVRLLTLFEIGSEKIRSQMAQIMRHLRYTQID